MSKLRSKEKKHSSFTVIGGSSILTIFAVLCFIVFALLSLSTAKADYTLADKTIQATTNYYKADTQAEEILAKLRQGEIPSYVERKGNQYEYSCAIDKNQELQVKVEITKNTYKVLQWQKVYIGEWKSDDTIEVWSGGAEITE